MYAIYIYIELPYYNDIIQHSIFINFENENVKKEFIISCKQNKNTEKQYTRQFRFVSRVFNCLRLRNI